MDGEVGHARLEVKTCVLDAPIHAYSVGDKVMVRRQPNRKHGSDRQQGPYTVLRVNENGTLRLSKATPNDGAVIQT